MDVDLLITMKKREGIAVYCAGNNLHGQKLIWEYECFLIWELNKRILQNEDQAFQINKYYIIPSINYIHGYRYYQSGQALQKSYPEKFFLNPVWQ